MVDPLPEEENSQWRRMMMDPGCRAAAAKRRKNRNGFLCLVSNPSCARSLPFACSFFHSSTPWLQQPKDLESMSLITTSSISYTERILGRQIDAEGLESH